MEFLTRVGGGVSGDTCYYNNFNFNLNFHSFTLFFKKVGGGGQLHDNSLSVCQFKKNVCYEKSVSPPPPPEILRACILHLSFKGLWRKIMKIIYSKVKLFIGRNLDFDQKDEHNKNLFTSMSFL